MKSAVNLKSKSGIHRLITSLEERGFIKRLKHKARAMEIINKDIKENTKFLKSNMCQSTINFYKEIITC